MTNAFILGMLNYLANICLSAKTILIGYLCFVLQRLVPSPAGKQIRLPFFWGGGKSEASKDLLVTGRRGRSDG